MIETRTRNAVTPAFRTVSLQLFCALVTLVSTAACGGGDDAGMSIDGELEQRCQKLCDITDQPACTSARQERCLRECRASVIGLASGCGTCLIDQAGSLQDDGESCEGGLVPDITESECGDFCADADHPGGASEIDARCSNHCNIDGEEHCTSDDQSRCLDDCNGNTSGIPFACGACLIDEGGDLQDDGESCEGGFVADTTDSDCNEFCAGM